VTRRPSIAFKFFVTYFVVAAAALAFAGAASWVQFRRYASAESDRQLSRQARLLAASVEPHLSAAAPDPARLAAEVDRLGKGLDVRMTVVLPDGEVVADSSVGAARVASMENHADREEVQAALAGIDGYASRRSITEKAEERYAAVPVRAGGRVVGVARVSMRAAEAARGLARIRNATLAAGSAAFLVMLAGTWFRGRRVAGPLAEMRSAVAGLAAGDLRRRAAVDTGDELEEVADGLNAMADRLEATILQLDAGKTRLSTLLENLSEGVLLIGRDRTIRLVNREAIVLLDAPGGAEDRPYTDVVRHPELLACIDAMRRDEPQPPRDIPFPSRGGRARIMRVTGTHVRFRGEREADLLLTLRDVTEERRLAQVKSEFVSNASHELRTPLTNIRGYLEAIQDSLAEGGAVDAGFLETAHANAIRMERLVDDLLELSRAESGVVPLRIEEVPLDAFLERVAAPIRPAADRAGTVLSVSAGPEPLRADLQRLSVALSNLAENAVKYGNPGGTVVLAGRIDGAEAVLEVADDGPGIPPEHLPRIFERFYRIDKGRSRELGGTGLGLSIVKHLVESHGGAVSVESRTGRGTRFTVRIPTG
jgi:two-component system phosphate regulon sensor histidine kinase PhoR